MKEKRYLGTFQVRNLKFKLMKMILKEKDICCNQKNNYLMSETQFFSLLRIHKQFEQFLLETLPNLEDYASTLFRILKLSYLP